MKRPFRLLLSALFLLSACSSHQKKILIYANSNIQVDESQKNITVTEGNSQVEKELNFSGSDPVVLNITGPNTHYTLEANEDGLWLQYFCRFEKLFYSTRENRQNNRCYQC